MSESNNTELTVEDCYDLMAQAAHGELLRAKTVHPGLLKNYHEGYAILLEEVDELWTEIKAKVIDPAKVRKEAIQVAAMALRIAAELN